MSLLHVFHESELRFRSVFYKFVFWQMNLFKFYKGFLGKFQAGSKFNPINFNGL